MQAFFKSPMLKAILAFVALILLGLAVWFIGPWLAFGELRPLETASMRITTIVLLCVLVILALLDWTLSIVGVTALSLLVWHAGPLFAFGATHPFAPVWARATLIGLILVCYVIWALYKLWQLIRNDAEFARKLFRPGDASQNPAKAEIRAISDMARKAVGQLKQMHMTVAGGTGSVWSGLRRLVEGKRYLYELPWYMIIGNPGAGKTTVLLNSGLKFPVAEQLGAASAKMTLSQNTGTQQCAWWFTNEAVLIDTAGRYTAPDDGGKVDKIKPYARNSEDAAGAAWADQTGQPDIKLLTMHEQVNRAEWRGFLGVLRQTRTRAPVNGALLAVDVAELLSDDHGQRMAHAARLRARLAELRQELGIRFPVYVVLTKADVLRGFSEYFSSLTTEARAQVWGFTLPWVEQSSALGGLAEKGLKVAQRGSGKTALASDALVHGQGARADWPLTQQLRSEIEALVRRIGDGVATRMQEEFEIDRRQTLYLLPHEMAALQNPLVELLDAVFSDSRFDTTQLTHMLRGVYFTSAMQDPSQRVEADPTALVPRLRRTLGGLMQKFSGKGETRTDDRAMAPVGTRSYFVTDALTRVVFPEAHLVKPNLKWEARLKLLRLVGHALVIVIFFWLAGALTLSYNNNKSYLQEVGTKADALTTQVRQLFAQPNAHQSGSVLTLSQTLPLHAGLDLGDPSSAYLYGLYTAEPINAGAQQTYAYLQDKLMLPVILKRMEYVMRESIASEDSKRVYDTLGVYLLLHDAPQFESRPGVAQDVRNWVIKDWQDSSGQDRAAPVGAVPATGIGQNVAPAAVQVLGGKVPGLAQTFNNSAAMVAHLESMFSGQRVVQSSSARNESLVRQARGFLDKTSSSERLYERAKAALANEAPQDFTLARALGPNAGTLFSRASGTSLEKGVSGLFTFDGYHQSFAKKLPELVAVAMQDDAWVMGRLDGVGGAAQKKSPQNFQSDKVESTALAEDIRRLYLSEYARLWSGFLEDLRLVKAQDGGTLAFELNVLRQLAAPDSPLVRLGRMAARETTLSRSLQNASAGEGSIFDKATMQLEQQKGKAEKGFDLRPEQRIERQYVDDRFSALREVVTGQSEGAAQPGAKPGLDTVTNVLNEYYTVLVVADTAITAGSLPPAGAEAATKLKIEAGKMPAPLREILLGIGSSGAERISQGAANILRVQAQAQMDKLVGMLALMVSEPCRRGIAGRYPFAASAQEVAIDDFNALFAAGGAADEYFTKFLGPLVDTSSRPWRYKNPQSANLQVGTDAAAGQGLEAVKVGPTLTGELLKLLASNGPNPETFAQIAQIRELFFREPGAKRMAWKGDLKVESLEPTVTELVIDIDGQSLRYAHGPVQPLAIQWPGPRGGASAEITAHPRIKTDTSGLRLGGPWALLRLMERGKITNTANTGRVAVEFAFDNRRVVLDVGSAGGGNPFNSTLLRNFTCPGRAS